VGNAVTKTANANAGVSKTGLPDMTPPDFCPDFFKTGYSHKPRNLDRLKHHNEQTVAGTLPNELFEKLQNTP
jgi:hypothetical protein